MNQLDVSTQIFQLLESGKVATSLAKATTPTLSKFYGVVSSSYKDIAQGFSKSVGSTEDMRKSLEGVYKPIEGVATSIVKGDTSGVLSSGGEIFNGIAQAVSDMAARSNNAMSESANNILKTVEQAYSKPVQVNENRTVNVNVKVEGDANTAKMDKEQITRVMIESVNDPNTQTALGLEGKNQLSAATGKK